CARSSNYYFDYW
nr:immunoglobulin heavy chain junction region [Mus musculus]MBK4198419.1 immunoglobulin heavy chain junction region [Mus musculus]MBK4198420.1 immunoglobulin heavy chain junction region [Mus musculus]MBK4198426.1 immunoglobulin heavy chain junction region [Mus musculus]